MTAEASQEHQAIRTAVRELCRDFPDAYWRQLDETNAYPEAFVRTLSDAGWLAALIPEAYGGAGLGIAEASIVLEEIHRSGGNAAACHAQMYIMGTLLRHGSEAQKQGYLPGIAAGELRLQAFGVTEPNAGSETTRIQTFAERHADRYLVNGQKIWTSRAEHSDLLLLLARTTPYDELSDKTRGLSVFVVDLRAAVACGQITIRPIRTMMNHNTTELFIQDLEVPRENLIGEEGLGFRYIIDGWNAERILIAAECIGDGQLVPRAGGGLCADARGLWAADRQQPGGAVSAGAEPYGGRGGGSDALACGRALRCRQGLRGRGEYGQVSRGRGELGGGERVSRHAWGIRLRRRGRRGAQVS